MSTNVEHIHIQVFICYWRNSVITNLEKEKLFKGLKNSFYHKQISITGGSVIEGFNHFLNLSLCRDPNHIFSGQIST